MSADHFSEFINKYLQAADPDLIALVDAKNTKYSYQALRQTVDTYKSAIASLQTENDVICLAPVGFELICCLLACFENNKTVVFIDPKLGLKNFFKITYGLKNCAVLYKKMSLSVFLLKIIFSNLKFLKLDFKKISNSQITDIKNDWLIDGFTSGTTGEIKRIRRQHVHMIKSAEIFSQHIIHIKDDRHLIGYTLSAIRNLIDHGTAFTPPKNLKNIFSFIETEKINRISGPPYLSYQAALAYAENNKTNVGIKNIVMGGAPVQKWLLLMLQKQFPAAVIQNIYGCTECEPIAHARAEDILKYQGLGHYVGFPVKELRCEFEQIQDDIFELIVHGEHVTKEHGHKTGDLIKKNSDGSLSLVGRKKFILINDRKKYFGQYELETLIENQFLNIFKAAVLQKKMILNIWIEAKKSIPDQSVIEKFVAEQMKQYQFSKYVIHFTQKLPKDSRHQWKVQYHLL